MLKLVNFAIVETKPNKIIIIIIIIIIIMHDEKCKNKNNWMILVFLFYQNDICIF